MPSDAGNRAVELSQLVRELSQAAAAVRRNTMQLKSSIYGQEPPQPAEGKNLDRDLSIMQMLSSVLRDLSDANDRLAFMRDSCNLGMAGGQIETSQTRQFA
jgi:hypothetical protein